MTAPPDRPSPELPEPPVRTHRLLPRLPDEPEPPEPAPRLDPERDLPGAVFMVPNRHWGFESTTSADHPGACIHYQTALRSAILLKGTDAEKVHPREPHYYVAATHENGLHKLTAFELTPRYFRLHRVGLLYPERHLGRLDEATLHALCEELARLHPEG